MCTASLCPAAPPLRAATRCVRPLLMRHGCKAGLTNRSLQSAGLVEAAATAVLASRLRSHAGVSCSVDCTLPGLMSGRVERARITGVAWQSQKNLTCRSLDFAVGAAALDAGALLSRGVLALSAPARGEGSVVFTARDFGHFLSHPLFAAAATRAVSGRRFAFGAGSVAFEPAGVRFTGVFDGVSYGCVLKPPPRGAPPPRKASVLVSQAADGPAAHLVALELTRFFSTLRIDLEGTALTFADCELSADAKLLTLRLGVEVTRFPRTDFAF